MSLCLRAPVYTILTILSLMVMSETRVFKLGLLTPLREDLEFSGFTSASAVSIAIDAINRDPILSLNGEIQLSIVMRDSDCRSKKALGQAIDLWFNHSVGVFIGPPCSVAARAVAEVASFFDLPMISWVATDPDLNDRTLYSTLSRTLGPFSKMGMFLTEVLDFYNWQRAVVISSNDLLYIDAGKAIRKAFNQQNITIAYQSDYDKNPTQKYVRETLEKAKIEGRIVILICPKEDRRQFMLQALDLRMCEGEYVFITTDMLPDAENLQKDFVWEGSDGRDIDARRAFDAVLHVSLAALTGAEVKSFRHEVKRRMHLPPWKESLAQVSEEFEMKFLQGDRYSPFLHDAVKLYAIALAETIRKGQDVNSGHVVSKNMRDKVFQGYTGSVLIDNDGDREPDYWISDLDPTTGAFVKIAEYINKGIGEKVFNTDIIPPNWPDGRIGHENAPSDTPLCGFQGELCDKSVLENKWLLALMIVAPCVIVAVSVLIAVISYRRDKFEKDLIIQSWRIHLDEIEMINKKGAKRTDNRLGSSSMGSGGIDHCSSSGSSSLNASLSNANKSMRSIISHGSNQNQLFADIGFYRGMVVALKKIRKEHIQLTRSVLMEFSEIKDVAHENLNVFAGAVIDLPDICLVWMYCNKGSLQDILMNDDIKIDETFKLSFMTDISKGMEYLQKSQIHSHGNLKSSNCLIDARWTCRITDYGLPTVSSTQDQSDNDQDKYRQKLWTAPEILRENFPPPKGTQKGDVYSFAIICYEIMMRSEPYTFDTMTPRDVVNRVRNGESIPFRPQLPESSELSKQVISIIKKCWDECPESRPTFMQIRSALRKITRGDINIIDNIMAMMETYASNLEEIVAERTLEFGEEKKKTDRLLDKMLPSTVAEQLKAGLVVKPENYDQSTIYFSDIVGFTTISADSSPMQIVDFLNDLYTCFDDIIAKHDVYKVETIGDAYMVVSGVPVRNGSRHAVEIANCALDLLSSVTQFKIKHRPQQQLMLRIGLNSGPVVAGVVGLVMPRYCLFGDTVNVAASLEAKGKPLRIHIAHSTYVRLSDAAEFDMTLRGEMNIRRGKGFQKTYWLHGKKGYDKPLPVFDKDEC